MTTLQRFLIRLIPIGERNLVIRELDDLAVRRSNRGRGLWYSLHILHFAIRLRGEQLAHVPQTLANLLNDLMYATRRLLRRPAYFGTAAVTLGVGIGGTVTVYAAANWVLLRQVPGVGSPDELVIVRLETTEDWGSNVTWGISDPDFESLRDRLPSLNGLLGSATHDIHLRLPGDQPPERVSALLVTPEYFDVLQVIPAGGRFFIPGEHHGTVGPAEVVLSYDRAVRHWGSISNAVGSSLFINGSNYRVVGVAPPGFRGAELPGSSEAWLASSAIEDVRPREPDALTGGRVQLWNQLIGRRAESTPIAQVAHEANAAMVGIRNDRAGESHSFMPSHFLFRVYDGIGLDPWVRQDVRQTLFILGSASVLLLLLTVANVANLGIARSATRRTELAIRRALGAGVFRVTREPLLEGLVVGIGGALVGGATAMAAERLFGEANLAARGASLQGMQLDLRVFLVCGLVALVTAMLSAVAPAILSRPHVVSTTLVTYGHGAVLQRRLSRTLVIAQVAVSGVLAVTAGLFARTIINLQNVELGFQPAHTVTFSIDTGLNGYDNARASSILNAINRDLRSVTGVESAGVTYPAPLETSYYTNAVKRPDQRRDEVIVGAGFGISGQGTLDALGLTLLAGRPFRIDLAGPETQANEVILSERTARTLFPADDVRAVTGQLVDVGFPPEPKLVVGIVADTRIVSPRSEPFPLVLTPYSTDFAEGAATFFLRTQRPAMEVLADVRRLVAVLDPELPIFDTGTGAEKIEALFAEQRVLARLATVLGSMGLILAAVGLYGLLAYSVTERTREIGIRSALGANTRKVRRDVLRAGFALTLAGLLIAFPLTFVAGSLVASRLHGVSFLDPLTLCVGAVVLLGVAMAASWIPALKATRISPLEALRSQ